MELVQFAECAYTSGVTPWNWCKEEEEDGKDKGTKRKKEKVKVEREREVEEQGKTKKNGKAGREGERTRGEKKK